MFENLTERLSSTLRKLGGKATLTENNIQEALREVRRALLEADVALPVVKDFVERVTCARSVRKFPKAFRRARHSSRLFRLNWSR